MDLGPPPPEDTFVKTLTPETLERVQKVKEFFLERYEQGKVFSARNVSRDYTKLFSKSKRHFSDYEVYSILGRGAMGEVLLVKDRKTKKFYALKKQAKQALREQFLTTHVRRERNLLIRSLEETIRPEDPHAVNWIVEFQCSFQDSNYVYLVMEYCPGGNLAERIDAVPNRGLPIRDVAFYVAELILGIESLHKLHYVHRDLKPENVLISEYGHLKLTDFGVCAPIPGSADPSEAEAWLAKLSTMQPVDVVQDVTFHSLKKSICRERRASRLKQFPKLFECSGTPRYMAPEIFRGKGYQYECDWWSLGCVMYELLYGHSAFSVGMNPFRDLVRKIMDWRNTLHYPETAGGTRVPEEAIDLMKMFLAEPEDRVGSRHTLEAVKKHRFFAMNRIFFENIHMSTTPWKPDVPEVYESQLSESYVATHVTGENPVLSRKTKDLLFKGFTFEGPVGAAASQQTVASGAERGGGPEDADPWKNSPLLFPLSDSDEEEDEEEEEDETDEEEDLSDDPWANSAFLFEDEDGSEEDGEEEEEEGEEPLVDFVRHDVSEDSEEDLIEKSGSFVMKFDGSGNHVDEDGVIWVDVNGAWWDFERPKDDVIDTSSSSEETHG